MERALRALVEGPEPDDEDVEAWIARAELAPTATFTFEQTFEVLDTRDDQVFRITLPPEVARADAVGSIRESR